MPGFSPRASFISSRHHLILQCISLVHHLRCREERQVHTTFAFAKSKSASANSPIYLRQFPLDESFQSHRHSLIRPYDLGGYEETGRMHSGYCFPNLLFHTYTISSNSPKSSSRKSAPARANSARVPLPYVTPQVFTPALLPISMS